MEEDGCCASGLAGEALWFSGVLVLSGCNGKWAGPERGPGGAQQGLELEVVGYEEMRDFSSNTQKEFLLAD